MGSFQNLTILWIIVTIINIKHLIQARIHWHSIPLDFSIQLCTWLILCWLTLCDFHLWYSNKLICNWFISSVELVRGYLFTCSLHVYNFSMKFLSYWCSTIEDRCLIECSIPSVFNFFRKLLFGLKIIVIFVICNSGL